MSRKIKIFIDCFIVISIIIFLALHHHLNKQRSIDEKMAVKDLASIASAMQEFYGPGKFKPYEHFLKQYPNNPIQDFSAYLSFFKFSELPVLTSSAPQGIKERIPEIEKMTNDLKETLKNGNFLLVPEEINSLDQILHPTHNSYIIGQCLLQLGYYYWMNGRFNESIDIIKEIHQFEKASKSVSVFDSNSNLFFSMLTVNQISALLWYNPKQEQNQSLDNFLSTIQPFVNYDKEFPDLINYFYFIKDYAINPYLYNLQMILSFTNWPKESYAVETLKKHHIIPAHPLNNFLSANYINKWTSRWAMEKRVNSMPEDFWKNSIPQNSIKSSSISKDRLLSSVLQQNGQTNDGFSLSQKPSPKLIERYNTKISLLKSTLWARCFRDQNNRWPENDEFEQQNPMKDTVSLVNNHDEALLARKLLSLLFDRTGNRQYPFSCTINTNTNTINIQPHFDKDNVNPDEENPLLDVMRNIFREKALTLRNITDSKSGSENQTSKKTTDSSLSTITSLDYFYWLNDVYERLPLARNERVQSNKEWLDSVKADINSKKARPASDILAFSLEFQIPSKIYWTMITGFETEYTAAMNEKFYKTIFENEREKELSPGQEKFTGMMSALDDEKKEYQFLKNIQLAGWE